MEDKLECYYKYEWYARGRITLADISEIIEVIEHSHDWDRFLELKKKLEDFYNTEQLTFPMSIIQVFLKNGELESTSVIPLTEYNFKDISEATCVWISWKNSMFRIEACSKRS